MQIFIRKFGIVLLLLACDGGGDTEQGDAKGHDAAKPVVGDDGDADGEIPNQDGGEAGTKTEFADSCGATSEQESEAREASNAQLIAENLKREPIYTQKRKSLDAFTVDSATLNVGDHPFHPEVSIVASSTDPNSIMFSGTVFILDLQEKKYYGRRWTDVLDMCEPNYEGGHYALKSISDAGMQKLRNLFSNKQISADAASSSYHIAFYADGKFTTHAGLLSNEDYTLVTSIVAEHGTDLDVD